MKAVIAAILTLTFLNLFRPIVLGQSKVYVDQCKLIRDLINAANKSFFNFQKMAHDSTITILDVNHILKDCTIESFGQVRVIIINSGEQIDKIKKEGIFSLSTRRKDLFIFTKELLNNLTGFRIFYPKSNGDCYWGFIVKKNRYYFSKKSFGWF